VTGILNIYQLAHPS